MIKINSIIHAFSVVICLLLSQCSLNDQDSGVIVPEGGYNWPDNSRQYWPTEGWQLASMEEHDIDVDKMAIANQFAENDPLARALVVVKDGYIVYENYYGDGGIDESTNLWSVTKSFASALTGLLIDDNIVSSPDELMADLLPDYPEFNDIKLQHVLTMTTGLSWAEEGPLWVDWIFSDDWVTHALERGQLRPPGKTFKYSSGNSHFLTSLVYYKTNTKLGTLAKERLFDPMGIEFQPLSETIVYNNWNEYKEPLYQSWRQDTKGIECASFSLYLKARDMAKFGYLYLNR
ncbi:MAG: serine hydrolase, partial [Melioribacteraceae bacterium]|nr:serine hydrolase [Melioribacteraceae bacterium]